MMSKDSYHGDHNVGVLVTERTNPFEMGVATELFGLERPELPGRPYRLETCGPGPVQMRQGFFTLTPSAPLEALVEMDTIIVPCHPTPDVSSPDHILDILRSSASNGARIVSFCSGSLLLAEAGILEGKRATTHWQYIERLMMRFPQVNVSPDVLFVEDDPIYTSAGSAASLDLALHLIRLDHGEEAVNIVARRLVFAAHRHGDQRQFVDPPKLISGSAPSFAALEEFVEQQLHRSIPVPALADRMGMSNTSFHRWFKKQTQQTPQQWVIARRITRARALLESSGDTVEVVSHRCGFGTATNLRQHFRRAVGVTPTAYRTAFRINTVATSR